MLEQERERAKNRIGNLTLVTGPLNIPMSNGPWADKRSALAEHSNIRLNAGLSALEVWDEDAIEKRALTHSPPSATM
ncbi:MAG: HNH endonuclease family protein [Acidimicrobiales bacterium]